MSRARQGGAEECAAAAAAAPVGPSIKRFRIKCPPPLPNEATSIFARAPRGSRLWLR